MTTITRKATIAGLLAMGWTLDPNPSTSKYQVYRHQDYSHRFLIGRSGALRKMQDGGTVAGSLSMTGGRYHAAICRMVAEHARFDTTYMCQDAVYRLMNTPTMR